MAVSRSYKHIVNGDLVDESGLVLSVRDIGFLRGYGVFDFLVTYNQKPFRLPDHIDRLYASAQEIGLQLPYPKSSWAAWTETGLQANADGKEKWIRLIATGGIGSNGMTASTDNPTTIVMFEPRTPCPASWYEHGVSIMSAPFLRHAPRAKTLHYVDAVMRTKDAAQQGAVEILYHDNGEILEGATSNIFSFHNGRWHTPGDEKILGGITRKVVLTEPAITAATGAVEIGKVSYQDLIQAQEVFITASNKEILPVVRIDTHAIGSGQVGEKTKAVMSAFLTYCR